MFVRCCHEELVTMFPEPKAEQCPNVSMWNRAWCPEHTDAALGIDEDDE